MSAHGFKSFRSWPASYIFGPKMKHSITVEKGMEHHSCSTHDTQETNIVEKKGPGNRRNLQRSTLKTYFLQLGGTF